MRLRQVALVASDLEPVAGAIQRTLDLPDPYADPGVGEFGLVNAVFEVGTCFLEVVTPATGGTAAGRHLERLGGDGGYMAIFQTDDIAAARGRVADLGVRVVWQHDLADIGGTHLHPGDVPGAIVSIDWATPAESWRWAGPRWTGGAPDDARPGGITSITVAAADPAPVARRWAEVLGVAISGDGVIRLDHQVLRFEHAADDRPPVIAAVGLAVPGGGTGRSVELGGVRFDLGPAE